MKLNQLIYVNLGMTSIEAILTTTRNAAHAIKMEKDLGTIEVGKLADIPYRLTQVTDRKAQQLAARVQFTHTLTIGDVVYTSWGYEQTNVSFYEVTRVVSGRSVGIRPLATLPCERSASSMSGYCSTMRGTFTGNKTVRRVRQGNVVVNADGHHSGYLWDGAPK